MATASRMLVNKTVKYHSGTFQLYLSRLIEYLAPAVEIGNGMESAYHAYKMLRH